MAWTFSPFTGTLDYYQSSIVDWQESVKDRDLTAPPVSPTLGDRYIVALPATGAWAGEENNIAEYNGSSWYFTAAEEGIAVWVEDENVIYVYNGTSWVKLSSVYNHNDLSSLQGGTTDQYYHLTSTAYGYLQNQNQSVYTTSEPTFAKLTVDNLVIDANTISSSSGVINLTPYAGSAVVLDSHFSFDANYIAGLTDVNSYINAYSGNKIYIESVGFDGGLMYLSNNKTIYWRNAADNAWLNCLNLDASNIFNIGTEASSLKLNNVLTVTGGALGSVTTLSMNNQLTNTLADGTAPFVITSTTKVSNLNADRLDDKHYTEGASFPVSPLDGDLFWNTTDEAFYRYYSAGGDWIQVGGGGMATVSDTAFAASWDTITDVAPSKNTIYDMVNTTVTLGTSDVLVPSQKAVKTYVDTSIENFNNINFQIDGIDGFALAQDGGLAFIVAFTDTNAGIIGSCIVPQSGTYRLEIRHSNYGGNPTNDIDVRIYACSQNGSEAFSWDLDSATAIQITKPAGQEIIYTRAKDYVLTAGDRVGFYIYKTDNCDGNAGTWSIRGVRLVLQ